MKDNYTTNSPYLIYTFPIETLGECSFWTWQWKGSVYRYTCITPILHVIDRIITEKMVYFGEPEDNLNN